MTGMRRHGWIANFHRHTALRQRVEQFAHLVLRTADRHALARNDDDGARLFEQLRRALH